MMNQFAWNIHFRRTILINDEKKTKKKLKSSLPFVLNTRFKTISYAVIWLLSIYQSVI